MQLDVQDDKVFVSMPIGEYEAYFKPYLNFIGFWESEKRMENVSPAAIEQVAKEAKSGVWQKTKHLFEG